MTRPKHFALATILGALGLGLLCGVTSRGEGPVAAPDLANLVKLEIKNMDAELAKASFSKKGQKRVRMAAFMIALYAQQAMDNSLRDQAIKVMQAADTGKADETKKLVAGLSQPFKAPAGKVVPIALEKQLDIETLMRMFSSEKVGGFGMEKALEDLVEAKTLDAIQLEKTRLLGQKISLIALVAHAYAPTTDKGSKTKKSWDEYATEMQKEAGELADAAHAKKDAEVGKIANKLTATCTKCHDIFR